MTKDPKLAINDACWDTRLSSNTNVQGEVIFMYYCLKIIRERLTLIPQKNLFTLEHFIEIIDVNIDEHEC